MAWVGPFSETVFLASFRSLAGLLGFGGKAAGLGATSLGFGFCCTGAGDFGFSAGCFFGGSGALTGFGAACGACYCGCRGLVPLARASSLSEASTCLMILSVSAWSSWDPSDSANFCMSSSRLSAGVDPCGFAAGLGASATAALERESRSP